VRTLLPETSCPCGHADAKGRLLSYDRCCGRYIDHWEALPAPDAEALMRSRYTAFVREDATYLLATWHGSQRPQALDFEPAARWLGLEVKAFEPTGEDTAEVEFVARYRLAGRAVRLHERSRFVREGGRWYYVDGEQS
jgi:SEC-C motif-containing protein